MEAPATGSNDYDDEWSSLHDRDTATRRDAPHDQPPTKRRRTDERGLMRDGPAPGFPRFIGSGSGIHFIRTVYDALARASNGGTKQGNNNRTHQHQPSGDLVPGEDDQLVDNTPGDVATPGTRARTPFWAAGEIIHDTEPTAPPITFDNLVEWTKSYFDNWHPLFPFLHGAEVLDVMDRVATQDITSVSDADACMVKAMVSISLADSRQLGRRSSPVPSSLVLLSQEDIASSLVFAYGTPASLKNIQAAVSVQLFLVSMLRFNMASRLGGIIVRMSFHLGLHRCPGRYHNFDPQEAIMRKRIWWSIYCLERMVCQSLGLPLDVADDDLDVCLPSQELHRASPHTQSLGWQPRNDDGQLRLLTILSKQARIRGMILELRNKSIVVRHDNVERALQVQAELTRWANTAHDMMEDDEEDGNEGETNEQDPPCISAAQRTLLTILQHESTIQLNRPLVASKTQSPASEAALQACISSSRAIIETIDDPRMTKQGQSIMLWPLLTWSVWMSCFILTYAALEGMTTVVSAQRYARRSLRILQQLSSRGTTWPDSCARAVEHLVQALDKRRRGNMPSAVKGSIDASTSAGNHRHSASFHRHTMSRLSHEDSHRRRETTDFNNPTMFGPSDQISYSSGSFFPPRNGFDPAASTRETPNTESTAYSGDGMAVNNSSNNALSNAATDMHNKNGFAMAEGGPAAEMDMYGQGWMDPLGALDFSNFAQAGTSDSAIGLRFY